MKSEEEKNEITTLVDSVTEQSQSEQDRLQLDKLKSLNLLRFIDAQIERATARDDLKSSVEAKIHERLGSNSPDYELNNVELIKLLEILNKNNTDFSSSVMSSITELYRIKQEEENSPKNASGKETIISKEDLKAFRELSGIFKKLTKEEFPELDEEEDEETEGDDG